MPRIKEYTSQVSTPGPLQARNAAPEDFGAAEGQGLQTLGSGIEKFTDVVGRRIEQNELSKAHVGYSEYVSQKSTEFNELVKKGDPDLIQKFMSSYEEGASKLRENITTKGARQYLDKIHSSHKGQFLELAANGQQEIAATEMVTNFKAGRNAGANALFVNPSAYKQTVQSSSDFLESLVQKGLPRKAAIELQHESTGVYGEAAVRGWMKLPGNGPDLALEKLKSGEFDDAFSEDVKNQLFGEIESVKSARRADLELQRSLAQRALKERQDKAQIDGLRELPKGTLTFEKLLDKSGPYAELDFSQIQAMRGALKEYNANGGFLTTKPQVEYQVYQGVMVNGRINDPSEIRKMVGNGLDVETAEKYVKMLHDRSTPQGKVLQEQMKGLLNQAELGIGTKKPGVMDTSFTPPSRAVGAFNLFHSMVQQELEAAKGDINIQRELLTPGSPKYLGKRIQNFKPDDVETGPRESVQMKREKPGGITIDEISAMPMDELMYLDKRGLKKEQLQAAARRYKQLMTAPENPTPDVFGPELPQ